MFNQNLKNEKIAVNDKNYLKKIIYAYKKLKQIAKHESNSDNPISPRIANLNDDQLEKIKLLESKLGCRLIAYENSDLEYRKSEILEGLHILLDEYLSLYSSKIATPVSSHSKQDNKVVRLKKDFPEIVNEDFNGFFQ